MCAGSNINEKNPTHISAYLKRLSGWAGNVIPLQHDQEVELPAGQNHFAMFAKSAGEYFLIENRRKSGRDAALTDEGLAIWHIDEDGNNSNEQMTPAAHYELSLMQADGKNHLEKSAGQFGDATDLYGRTVKRFADGTSPGSKWWDGTASNLELLEITAPGASMRFKARLFADGGSGGGGVLTIEREATPARSIPDNTASGVTDTIFIDQDATIASTEVKLDITHPFRGDLQVTLQTPWAAQVRLHQRSQGGSADHIQRTYTEADLPVLATFHGRSTKGNWQLTVQDLAPADVGKLNRWGLKFTATGQPQGPVVLSEAAGILIPDNNPAGIVRSLPANAPGKVGSVEVSVDITHTYVGDLRVSLRSPAGTEVVLHNLTGGAADNLVKTYTPATTAGLGTLAGQAITGAWRLAVSDRAGQDIGKLNTRRVVIQPAV